MTQGYHNGGFAATIRNKNLGAAGATRQGTGFVHCSLAIVSSPYAPEPKLKKFNHDLTNKLWI
jgi:hypothetical protein